MANIVVIGSGPAGIMASLFAALPGNKVTIIDSNEHVGRKLLVTGAGRCNLTNTDVAAVRYACDNPVWLNTVLNHFSREDLLKYLGKIGIPAFSTFDGWYYPVSESAHAVVDAFDFALDEKKVQKMLRKLVTGIEKAGTGFNVMLHRDALSADRVVIACGGNAYPALGSDGSLYDTIRHLGHKIHPLLPALAPITADMRDFKALQGIRLDADVSLLQAGKVVGKTFGNIIFTQWGVNGPGVMDLSYMVGRYPVASLELEINLLHRYEDQVMKWLTRKQASGMSVKVIIQSVLPPKMTTFLLRFAGISPDTNVSQLNKNEVERLKKLLTTFTLKVTGTRGFDQCQVTAGGVDLKEVDPETMGSLLVPGLFFAGEVLDVTGPCGGYNLQFAFSSGAVAGMAAGK